MKNKYILLKKNANWAKLSSLVLTEQEETKTRYFAPIWLLSSEGFEVVKEVSKAVKSAQT